MQYWESCRCSQLQIQRRCLPCSPARLPRVRRNEGWRQLGLAAPPSVARLAQPVAGISKAVGVSASRPRQNLQRSCRLVNRLDWRRRYRLLLPKHNHKRHNRLPTPKPNRKPETPIAKPPPESRLGNIMKVRFWFGTSPNDHPPSSVPQH